MIDSVVRPATWQALRTLIEALQRDQEALDLDNPEHDRAYRRFDTALQSASEIDDWLRTMPNHK